MNHRHMRQGFLGVGSEKVIKNARVAIIGLCGGGSHIAQQLAHVGVGNFDLYDYDHAEKSNTNRMVGLTASAARRQKLKVDVLERLIKSINPRAKVRKHPVRWEEDHLALRSCTAIFGCVDSYVARDGIERYARRYLVPYIDIGMDVHGGAGHYTVTGQVIMSLPDHLCMRCMGFITEQRLVEEAKRYGVAEGNPQVVWPNGTLASTAVGKFMSMITPWNEALLLPLYSEYDGNRFRVFPSNKLEALAGLTCTHYGGIKGVGDVSL